MQVKRWLVSLALGSVFLYSFKTIYNYFGHGVTSEALDSIWCWPLILIVFLLVIRTGKPAIIKTHRMRNCSSCYLLAVISIVIGRALTGIFEIAGTSSEYVRIYYWAAIVFIFLGSFHFIAAMRAQSLKQSNT